MFVVVPASAKSWLSCIVVLIYIGRYGFELQPELQPGGPLWTDAVVEAASSGDQPPIGAERLDLLDADLSAWRSSAVSYEAGAA